MVHYGVWKASVGKSKVGESSLQLLCALLLQYTASWADRFEALQHRGLGQERHTEAPLHHPKSS